MHIHVFQLLALPSKHSMPFAAGFHSCVNVTA